MADETRLIPAVPTTIVPLIPQALKDGPHKRSDLLRHVDRLARLQGFRADNLATLKKALNSLERDDRVVKPQYGRWALAAASPPEAKRRAAPSMGKRSEVKPPRSCSSDLPLRDSRSPKRYNRIWIMYARSHFGLKVSSA